MASVLDVSATTPVSELDNFVGFLKSDLAINT
jgi:hypothetical protein